MYALGNRHLSEINMFAGYVRPRRRSLRDRLISRFSVGHILAGQLLYEVHGPFEVAAAVQRRSGSPAGDAMRRVGEIAGAFAEYRRNRRAACELARLDERMLRDIGLSRTDIALAVSGGLDRPRP